MTMILNIDGSRTCVLMAQDLLNAPPPLTPLWELVFGGGGGEKEGQTFMLRMIRRASVNLKLKTEWNYYSYLAKISVKLLISAKNVSYNPNSAEISVKQLVSV